MDSLSYGTKISFKVPDSHQHENEVRNFMIIRDGDPGGMLHLMYANNECTCKDGMIKFHDIGKDTVTLDEISALLTKYYEGTFDPQTLKVI